MRGLIAYGYQAVYLTEHDTLWPAAELAELQAQWPQIRIFPGVELSVEGGGHLVVLGADDSHYLCTRDPAMLLELARAQGHLTVLAHPYRWDDRDAILRYRLKVDAIELRTNNHDAHGGKKSQKASRKYHLPMVNAGDIHAPEMLNRFWIETDRDLLVADDIRGIVLESCYANRDNTQEARAG